MKKNLIILLLALATSNLFAKTPGTGKVDPVVEDNFKKQYGASVNVSWEIMHDISIATFTDQGEEKQVYYFNDGQILGIGKAISRDLLPVMIKRSINQRFDSEAIQTVYEFRSKDAPTSYFIRLVTKNHTRIVSANEFGDIDVVQTARTK
jgi:hypothetical protein